MSISKVIVQPDQSAWINGFAGSLTTAAVWIMEPVGHGYPPDVSEGGRKNTRKHAKNAKEREKRRRKWPSALDKLRRILI